MPYYTFEVKVHYHTDQIWAETEEEARAEANDELQYIGEECDTQMELINVEYDEDWDEEEN